MNFYRDGQRFALQQLRLEKFAWEDSSLLNRTGPSGTFPGLDKLRSVNKPIEPRRPTPPRAAKDVDKPAISNLITSKPPAPTSTPKSTASQFTPSSSGQISTGVTSSALGIPGANPFGNARNVATSPTTQPAQTARTRMPTANPLGRAPASEFPPSNVEGIPPAEPPTPPLR